MQYPVVPEIDFSPVRYVARAVVMTPDREHVLLGLKEKTDGTIYPTLPGGGIDRGESPWEAASKEILQETGLEPNRYVALDEDLLMLPGFSTKREGAQTTIYPVFMPFMTKEGRPRDLQVNDKHEQIRALYWASPNIAYGHLAHPEQKQALAHFFPERLLDRQERADLEALTDQLLVVFTAPGFSRQQLFPEF